MHRSNSSWIKLQVKETHGAQTLRLVLEEVDSNPILFQFILYFNMYKCDYMIYVTPCGVLI